MFLLALTVALVVADTAEADNLTSNSPAIPASTSLTIKVTARKWTEPVQAMPGSVTVQTAEKLSASGARDLRDAAADVPNLTLGDFSVRRLTFPFIRGIGSGRNNPAVLTTIDGVPQLSYATANQELLDIDQVEFLRGSQGALYGRNTLGGVIAIVPMLPTDEPSAEVGLGFGDYAAFDAQAMVNGPMGIDHLLGRAVMGYSRRDGYTVNDVTGNRLDGKESLAGRGQVLWKDRDDAWSYRLSVSGEQDRDGDYALGDLASIRQRPHHVAHDYEGSSDRDIVQPVFTATHQGKDVDITSITAFQWWDSHDRTDLDTTPMDLLRRDNAEEQQAWLEELRFASPETAPITIDAKNEVRWLAGIFAFHSDYDQNAFTEYRPDSVALFGLPFPYDSHEDAALTDEGVSLFGQATWTYDERIEAGLGLRHDYEHRTADLSSYMTPIYVPLSATDNERDFSQTCPSATLGYHFSPDIFAYIEETKGYKAGGFNAAPVPGHGAFDEETSWTHEAGVKTMWLQRRVTMNVAVFQTDWSDLQMDMPAGYPGVFYIDNAGDARSRGGEVELSVRPVKGLNVFGSMGVLDTRLKPGSLSGGVDVGGNDLPFAPEFMWRAGADYSHELVKGLCGFVRGEVQETGSYYYDASNGAEQGDFVLVNARIGLAGRQWRVEGWVRNLFDEEYVPLAMPFTLAQSGYVGESGAPRTVGISFSRSF